MRVVRSVLPVALLACASVPPPETPDALRIMGYNVLYDAPSPEASVALIARENPDIVCLRELRPPMLKVFRAELGDRYPHAFVRARRSGTWGAAIFSKHPLRARRVFPAKPHRLPVLEATVRAPNVGDVVVACVHLVPPFMAHGASSGPIETLQRNDALRTRQAKQFVKRYRGRSPLVLVGDFNEEDDDAMETLYAAGFTNACDDADCAATWPGATSSWPAVVRIDHVLTRGLRVVAAHVPSGGGSDHQPIVAAVAR